MTTASEHAKVEAIGDQVHAVIRDRYDDVVRIAEEGPTLDEADQLFVRQVFYVVAGDIRMARANEQLESQHIPRTKTERLTATEINYRNHTMIAANSIDLLRATDIDRLVVELPEALSTGGFLRWLLDQADLPDRARARAVELKGGA